MPITKYLLLYAGSADDANFSKDLCFISMGNILNQFIEYIDSNNDYPPIGNLLILLNKPKLSPSKSPLLRKKATIGNDDKLLKKEVGRSSFMDIFKDMKDKLAKNEDQKDKKK